MKKTSFSESARKAIALKTRAIDVLVERMIEPIEDIGNPEKLIGKNYEDWTPEDLQKLALIYGGKEPNPLSNLIFRKEYTKVLELEKNELT